MIKQKKTKKKNVNVNQTVVVNIQKGKRNPRAKASAPQVMSAPQIIQPQVGSAYHQAVYGARAPTIPVMSGIPGYYGGMMSPFNAPLHVVSEVQQAQLRQSSELAGANLQRPSLVSSEARAPIGLGPMERVPERIRIPEPERMPQPVRRPISRLVREQEVKLRLQEKPLPSISQLQAVPPMPRFLSQLAIQQAPMRPVGIPEQAPMRPVGIPEQAPLQVVEEKRKRIRMSFYPGSYEELPFASSVSGVSDIQPAMSSIPISFPKPSAPLSMEAPEVVQFLESIQNRPMEVSKPASASESSSSIEAPASVSASSSSIEAPASASASSKSAPRRGPKIAPRDTDYGNVVDWIDRQTVKLGNSPIGVSKDAFIQQVSAQVGRQFTVGNIKNKPFDEIKRRAKKFISDIIDAGR